MGTDRASEAVAQNVLEQLSYAMTHLTETSERLATGVTNHVLTSRRYTFNTDGVIELSWGATCGAIKVSNHTANPIYVGSGPRSGFVTPSMPQIDPGICDTINVATRNVTLYGLAGGYATVQAFTKGGMGCSSVLAVDGGAP